MKKILSLAWIMITLTCTIAAQDDKVLLEIDHHQVMRSEFERIYEKNRDIQPAGDTQEENLNRFINFKLKVFEAENLGYDTAASFIQELAGYRDQLAKPYMKDRHFIDSLIEEAYYRTIHEVNASHIMVKLPQNPSPADTFKAYQKAVNIRNRLLTGESFEKIAREESDDQPAATSNSGNLGWFSAFSMILPIEDAAYRTPVGGFSFPVRTRYGYHIIRTNGFRPAMGEIRLAHIMVRGDRNSNEADLARAREKIDSCYRMLQEGKLFAGIARKYSEDAGSSGTGGLMRWLRSGELPPEIEEKVFALKDSGSYTLPIQSDYGWHIFQLQGKRPLPSLSEEKSKLEERLMADERGQRARLSFIGKIKKESGFIVYTENIDALIDVIDSTVYLGNWDPLVAGELIEPVFSIGGKEYTQRDLAVFMAKTPKYASNESFAAILARKSAEFIDQEILSYENSTLEDKYPEFRDLMKEYHDGILLFNIMNDMVWNRASNDSAGLEEFYTQHIRDYWWKMRADVSVYTFRDDSYLKKARKFAKKRITSGWSSSEVAKMVCGDSLGNCIVVKDMRVEQDVDPLPIKDFKWERGTIQTFRDGEVWYVVAVNSLIPPVVKSLSEVRGQVMADYQNFLDDKWIENLKARYRVLVHNEFLRDIP